MSAKDLLKLTFSGAKLANTTVSKIGKINKDIAFEIAVVNNGMYCGEATLTLVSKDGVIYDMAKANRFENKEKAIDEVNRLKSA